MLNGKASVDQGLADRVRAAVAELDYRPSAIARSLRTRSRSVWALVVADIRNPFYTEMIRGIEDIAYANGFSVVLCSSAESESREADYLQLAIDEQMAGVILAPVHGRVATLEAVARHGIPIVTVDRYLIEPEVDRVVVDNIGGARQAVEHLLDAGYRRIALISGPRGVVTADLRREGYQRALTDSGLAIDPALVRYAEFTAESGAAAMQELLTVTPAIDALFAANNQLTLGALGVLNDVGVQIPEQLAIVGFDDVPWANLLHPPLTTIAQPTYEMGCATATLLLARIRGYSGPAQEQVLATELRVRASSAPRTQ